MIKDMTEEHLREIIRDEISKLEIDKPPFEAVYKRIDKGLARSMLAGVKDAFKSGS